jgi:LytR cell envelope-related transcriptional attenuator
MDELRQHLDDEAGRITPQEDALERVKRRVGRRRVSRQIGTGVLALAVAAGGFALAVDAFSGPRRGRPMVGPTSTVSPSATLVVVAAPESLRSHAQALAARLGEAGYTVEVRPLSPAEVPSHTAVAYAVDLRDQAWGIIRRFLPGVSLTGSGYPDSHPPIEIRLAPSDYPAVTVRVRVFNAGGSRTAFDTAAGQLRGAGYDVVEVADAPAGYDETVVACAPQHDEAGSRILEEFFPDAEFRPELPSPDYDVTVYVGPDWYSD